MTSSNAMMIDYKKRKRACLLFLALYWPLFMVYLLVTRSPNYFTSRTVSGVVAYVHHNPYHWRGRSRDRIEPVIRYKVADSTYEYDNRYGIYMRSFKAGDSVIMVYTPGHPENAALVSIIGYWATADELMFSFLFCGLVVSLINVLYTPRLEEYDADEHETSDDDIDVLPSNHWL